MPGRLVVILGAGASADFGVPTLNHVFQDPSVRQLLSGNDALLTELNQMFWHPRGIDLDNADKGPNIEQMLTILREWDRERTNHPDLALRDPNLQRMRHGLLQIIQHAVYDGKSSQSRHLNPLCDYAATNYDHVTWATFNWDCILESSLWFSRNITPTPGIELRHIGKPDTRHTILKLHGGVNWWCINDRPTYLKFSAGGPLQGKWDAFAQNPQPTEFPIILEPSYYKYEGDASTRLDGQWSIFLSELLRCSMVLVVGYSLPDGDARARSIIATALQHQVAKGGESLTHQRTRKAAFPASSVRRAMSRFRQDSRASTPSSTPT